MRTPSLLAAAALAALSLTACTTTQPEDKGTAVHPSSAPAPTAAALASSPAADTGKAALEAAVRAYSKAWFAGDGAAAYGMLSKRCTSTSDKAVFTAEIAAGAKAYGKQAIKTLTVDQLAGDLARVSYTYGVPMLNQTGQPWTREGGAWHYDAC